jgi:hypothetical protein
MSTAKEYAMTLLSMLRFVLIGKFMSRIILLTLFFVPYLYAAESQHIYDPKLTEILQEKFKKLNSENFKQYRGEIQRLVEQGADPNICLYRGSLLSAVVLKGDEDLTLCLLAHGANPNPTIGDQPLFNAETVPIAKCLIKHKANINAIKIDMDENLLQTAVTQCRSAAIFGILLNGGVDPNRRDSYGQSSLHDLFRSKRRSEHLLKGTILLWGGALPEEKNSYGETPFDLLEEDEQFLVAPMRAIVSAIPKIKEEKRLLYVQTLPEYAVVATIMPVVQSIIVMLYAVDFVPWEESYWLDIKAAAGSEVFDILAAP